MSVKSSSGRFHLRFKDPDDGSIKFAFWKVAAGTTEERSRVYFEDPKKAGALKRVLFHSTDTGQLVAVDPENTSKTRYATGVVDSDSPSKTWLRMIDSEPASNQVHVEPARNLETKPETVFTILINVVFLRLCRSEVYS